MKKFNASARGKERLYNTKCALSTLGGARIAGGKELFRGTGEYSRVGTGRVLTEVGKQLFLDWKSYVPRQENQDW